MREPLRTEMRTLTEQEQRLRAYYHRGLPEDQRPVFDEMMREMMHLTRKENVGQFAMIYLLAGRKAVTVSAAIGFAEKSIERGYRGTENE